MTESEPVRRDEQVEDSFGGRSDRAHPNSVDVLRVLGALCIIWYHSAYFWSLQPSLQQAVQHVKLATISWSLPFFYTISGWLALLSTSRDASVRTVLRKLGGYAVLILGWSAVYATIQYATHSGQGLSGLLGASGSGLALVVALLQQIRGVFNTPVYYITDMMVIYVFAAAYGFALRAWPRLRGNTARWAMALVVVGLLLVDSGPTQAWSQYFFLSRFAGIGMCVGFACALVGMRPRTARKPLSPRTAAAILFAGLALFGALNVAWLGAEYWGDGAMRLSGLLFGLFPALGALVVIREGPGVLRTLSVAGSKYALGLLVTHQAAFYFLDWFVPGVVKRVFGGQGAGLPAFLLINIGATVLAIGSAVLLRRYAPALVTLRGRRETAFGSGRASSPTVRRNDPA